MFGSGNRVSAWSIHDDHTLSGRRLDIDIVHTDPGTADDLEVRCGLEDLRCNLRLAANNKRGKFRDDFNEFGFGQAGVDNDF